MANLIPKQLQLSDLVTLRGGGNQGVAGSFRPGGMGMAPPGFTPPPAAPSTNPTVVPGAQAGTLLPTQDVLSRIGAGGGFVGQQGVGASAFSDAINNLMSGQINPTFNPYAGSGQTNQSPPPEVHTRSNSIGTALDDILNTTQPVGNPQPTQDSRRRSGFEGLLAFSKLNPQATNGIFGEGGIESFIQKFQSMFTPFQVGNVNSGVLGVLRGLRGGRTR